MPREYKRKPGTRQYKNFTEETLEEAVLNVVINIIKLTPKF